MTLKTVLFCLLMLPLPGLAQETCPAAPDHGAAISDLIAALREAPDEAQARGISDALWQLWTDAPDARAQAMLDDGMERREAFDFLASRDILDGLVDYCPDYAEGYNQRAFTNFLRQDYAAALWDLDRALELNPTHTGALTGKALTLIGLGRADEAQEVLRAALELNPWLRERSLLVEPPGQDI